MVGDLEIELVQPLTGDNLYRDQLREAGEGIFHLRLPTDDIEQHLGRLSELGIEPVFGWHEGRWINVHLDSPRRYGVRAELILGPDKLARVLAELGRRESVPKAHAGEDAP
jgi:hypothetical protein